MKKRAEATGPISFANAASVVESVHPAFDARLDWNRHKFRLVGIGCFIQVRQRPPALRI